MKINRNMELTVKQIDAQKDILAHIEHLFPDLQSLEVDSELIENNKDEHLLTSLVRYKDIANQAAYCVLISFSEDNLLMFTFTTTKLK